MDIRGELVEREICGWDRRSDDIASWTTMSEYWSLRQHVRFMVREYFEMKGTAEERNLNLVC